MGWLWSSSGDERKIDPLKNLDPEVRRFLEEESPVKHGAERRNASPAPTPTYSEQIRTKTPSIDDAAAAHEEQPQKRPPSLFSDGRYDHLWKTYRPMEQLDMENKSEQDKLLDVLEGFKYRKAETGRAALENCAMEQWAVNDCFTHGGWKSRMTMCRDENRQLEKCYMMQARFLRALGYLSTFDRPPELEERIQMHADKLYHRMLEQEAAIEKAKAEGLPIPAFEPLLPQSVGEANRPNPVAEQDARLPIPSRSSDNTIDTLEPDTADKLKKHLETLPEEVREVEQRALEQEIKTGRTLQDQIGSLAKEREEARKQRQESGRQTLGDVVTRFFKLD